MAQQTVNNRARRCIPAAHEWLTVDEYIKWLFEGKHGFTEREIAENYAYVLAMKLEES